MYKQKRALVRLEEIIMRVLLGLTYLEVDGRKLFIGWCQIGIMRKKSANRNMEK
jgi:hypothetical protein